MASYVPIPIAERPDMTPDPTIPSSLAARAAHAALLLGLGDEPLHAWLRGYLEAAPDGGTPPTALAVAVDGAGQALQAELWRPAECAHRATLMHVPDAPDLAAMTTLLAAPEQHGVVLGMRLASGAPPTRYARIDGAWRGLSLVTAMAQAQLVTPASAALVLRALESLPGYATCGLAEDGTTYALSLTRVLRFDPGEVRAVATRLAGLLAEVGLVQRDCDYVANTLPLWCPAADASAVYDLSLRLSWDATSGAVTRLEVVYPRVPTRFALSVVRDLGWGDAPFLGALQGLMRVADGATGGVWVGVTLAFELGATAGQGAPRALLTHVVE